MQQVLCKASPFTEQLWTFEAVAGTRQPVARVGSPKEQMKEIEKLFEAEFDYLEEFRPSILPDFARKERSNKRRITEGGFHVTGVPPSVWTADSDEGETKLLKRQQFV